MVPEKALKSQEAPLVGILTGPTATGKSDIAIEMALRLGSIELINADSLLVYRHMDIGTAKPTAEELAKVPHHLVNIRDPNEPFTAGDFYRAAHQTIDQIHQRGKRCLIVGGTGFYLKALMYGLWTAPPANHEWRKKQEAQSNEALHLKLAHLDPASAMRISVADRYRLIRALEVIEFSGKTPTEWEKEVAQSPDPRFRVWIIDRPADELNARILQRVEKMLQSGLIEEVRELSMKYPEARPLSAVGYHQTMSYLKQVAPKGRKLRSGLGGLQDEIELATRQLVKQQRTWFKGQCPPTDASWFSLDEDYNKLEQAIYSVYRE